ncbi:3'-5' exonuclease [Streptococcus entericus]|uniref:3'-5' exonuclease n=1 Tax=Streptococcus entericus TaxID=155680 RepID=UPI00036CC6A6|nr:3'-5' exonuclease [Streptococcus entericus]
MEQLETYIAFDLEFIERKDGHYDLLQVSAVKFVDGQEQAHFDSYVHTDQPLKSFINGLTGITSDKIQTAPPAEQVVADFAAFVSDTALIGYNAHKSDLPILQAYGLDVTGQYVVDVYDEAFDRRSTDLNGISRLSLQSVATFLGIKGRGHNSLEDARMTAKIYEQFKEFDDNRLLLDKQETINNNPFSGLDFSGFLDE